MEREAQKGEEWRWEKKLNAFWRNEFVGSWEMAIPAAKVAPVAAATANAAAVAEKELEDRWRGFGG